MAPSAQGDLSGRTCVVTGASAGIGRATALALAGLGARVVMAVRDPKKGERVTSAPGAARGGELELAVVDLASQASIRDFAREVRARHPRIDVLVNNAGVWANRRRVGPDGIERTWATNVLAYFLVSELLLPALGPDRPSRIVNVASRYAHGLDLTDVEFRRRPYRGPDAYAQSKQADRMLTWALARRLEGTGTTANAVHPGFVATEIFAKGGGLLSRLLSLYAKVRARTPEQGADTVVWLAASPLIEGRSGRFWFDREERPCRFRDEEAEEALHRLCRDMTGGGEGGARGRGPIG
jgi:NAD(P)-dependent dehydrogenase (short-subunit alcohol dehydrogenase family)